MASQARASDRIDAAWFRQMMGGFATGVAVVTARDADQELHGMTVNSLTSVSLDPVLLLVCFTRDSRTAEAVEESGVFAVNLLSHGQMALSNAFSRPGEDRFRDVDYELDDDGVPLLGGGLGYARCSVDAVHDGGDHIIVVAAVRSCQVRQGEPLIFYRGRYVRAIDFEDYPVVSWWG